MTDFLPQQPQPDGSATTSPPPPYAPAPPYAPPHAPSPAPNEPETVAHQPMPTVPVTPPQPMSTMELPPMRPVDVGPEPTPARRRRAAPVLLGIVLVLLLGVAATFTTLYFVGQHHAATLSRQLDTTRSTLSGVNDRLQSTQAQLTHAQAQLGQDQSTIDSQQSQLSALGACVQSARNVVAELRSGPPGGVVTAPPDFINNCQ